MEKNDITVEILKDIREEIRNVRSDLSARIDQTNAELAETRVELKGLRNEMIQRITESEVRTATKLTDVVGAIHEVRDLLRDQSDLRPRVEKCESDIADIKRRLS